MTGPVAVRVQLSVKPHRGGTRGPTTSMPLEGPLVDRFGRVHSDLRISVTDRCNLRWVYCMPEEGLALLPQPDLLTFDELVRLARVARGLGITAVRITGGEPLVRCKPRTRSATPLFSPQYPTHYLGDTGWKRSYSADGAWTYSQVEDLGELHRLPCLRLLMVTRNCQRSLRRLLTNCAPSEMTGKQSTGQSHIRWTLEDTIRTRWSSKVRRLASSRAGDQR